MSCTQTIIDYSFRAIGFGARALPKSDITLCEQFVLIGSGLFWNVYFAAIALIVGFFAAAAIAFARNSSNGFAWRPAALFIFIIRGSPLFIQFFILYELFVLLPRMGWDLNFGFIEITVETRWLTKAWLGALIALFLNTTAYTAQIFYGALRTIPKGEIESALAMGMSQKQINKRIIKPKMISLAWESYTNEAIFLLHATALVFFSSFPAWRQEGDSLYYASYFADKTFNPFVAYPIIAGYFICLTLIIIVLFSWLNKRMNPHLKHQ